MKHYYQKYLEKNIAGKRRSMNLQLKIAVTYAFSSNLIIFRLVLNFLVIIAILLLLQINYKKKSINNHCIYINEIYLINKHCFKIYTCNKI